MAQSKRGAQEGTEKPECPRIANALAWATTIIDFSIE